MSLHEEEGSLGDTFCLWPGC